MSIEMNEQELKEHVELIAKGVAGLTFVEWSRVSQMIGQKYSAKSSKIILDDLAELENGIQFAITHV